LARRGRRASSVVGGPPPRPHTITKTFFLRRLVDKPVPCRREHPPAPAAGRGSAPWGPSARSEALEELPFSPRGPPLRRGSRPTNQNHPTSIPPPVPCDSMLNSRQARSHLVARSAVIRPSLFRTGPGFLSLLAARGAARRRRSAERGGSSQPAPRGEAVPPAPRGNAHAALSQQARGFARWPRTKFETRPAGEGKSVNPRAAPGPRSSSTRKGKWRARRRKRSAKSQSACLVRPPAPP